MAFESFSAQETSKKDDGGSSSAAQDGNQPAGVARIPERNIYSENDQSPNEGGHDDGDFASLHGEKDVCGDLSLLLLGEGFAVSSAERLGWGLG
jgi:hypothetical protein